MRALSLFLFVPAVASAGDFATLLSPTGWEEAATREHADIGTVAIHLKKIAGTYCLQGVVEADVSPAILVDVISDIPSTTRWSTAGLKESRVLGKTDAHIDYFQYLDVPNWTMASDRYWVLRGHRSDADGNLAFRWNRFDSRTTYPELYEELERDHKGAVEPGPNYGSWVFEPRPAGALARYYICSDPGGSLPEWLQRTAATRTLPDTVADVIREGRRRQSP